MIIIDAGATTTKVCTINNHNIGAINLYPGINPNYMSDDAIGSILADCLRDISKNSKVFYYGSGCARAEVKDRMKKLIQHQFGLQDITIYSDLLASARATAHSAPGQINILGTGSSSCIYDGHEITQVLPNYGYLFGDHGSGYQLGYALLQAYFDNRLDNKIQQEIESFSAVKKEALLRSIYQGETKAIIVRFAKCVHQLRHHQAVNELISHEFDLFITKQIKLHANYLKSDQYFTGSIAYYFESELQLCLQKHGLLIKKISGNPIEELCVFHLTYNQ